MVQIEAAAAAAKDAEKAKLVKKKSGGGRSGKRGGGRTSSRNKECQSSRRDAKIKRGETMRSERSRDRQRDSYRNSYRERENYGKLPEYEIERENHVRQDRSRGGE